MSDSKEFVRRHKAIFAKGNLATVTAEKAEVEKIGGKARIEEVAAE